MGAARPFRQAGENGLVRIAIAALFVLLAGACGANRSEHRGAATQQVALFGENSDASYLVQLDPRTLKEVGPKLRGVDRIEAGGAAVSPDGSQYLIGAGFMGSGSYGLASLRPLRWIDKSVAVARGPNGQAYVDAFAWLRPHRVFTLLEGTGGFCTAVVAGRRHLAPIRPAYPANPLLW
jgi:hypothetical protein